MKLAAELDFVVEKFKQIKGLEEYATKLKASGDYNDLETRLAWDCLRLTIDLSTICSWYYRYECTDAHITTLVKTALKIARGGT